MYNLKKYLPIILIIVIVLLGVAGYFLVWPEYENYVVKRKEFDTKDEEIKAKEEYLPTLEAISAKLLEFEDQVSKVETAIPIEPSIAALFNYFQKATSRNGLILKDIDVSGLFNANKTKLLERMESMPFSIIVTGSYSSLKTFLLDIYLNSRMINISSVNFAYSQMEDTSISDFFDFQISLETQSYSMESSEESEGLIEF